MKLIDQTEDGESNSDSEDLVLGLGGVDLSCVDFDTPANNDDTDALLMNPTACAALELERKFGLGTTSVESFKDDQHLFSGVLELGQHLASGKYIDVLKGDAAKKLLLFSTPQNSIPTTVASEIRKRIFSSANTLIDCIEIEFLGIAALNLFLQLNYTGPSLDEGLNNAGSVNKKDPLWDINPHACFFDALSACTKKEIESNDTEAITHEEKKEQPITTSSYIHTKYHNAVLAELAVDGEWPCQVCEVPYLLLLARSILLTLADPNRCDWMNSVAGTNSAGEKTEKIMDSTTIPAPESFIQMVSELSGARLWSVRASVAHARLLQSRETSETLWQEVNDIFQVCLGQLCPDNLIGATNIDTTLNPDKKESKLDTPWEDRKKAATVMLEWGLAQHHFDRPGMGKKSFQKAKEFSGLIASVTGASGKRTKFQIKNTAQMLVEAASTSTASNDQGSDYGQNQIDSNFIREQKVDHSEEEILLERIKFEDESKNEIKELTILDQAILLALCLDVKNSNPSGDELTAEEMGAYLARVLDHHDDWMLYSTALLERAWLEFERTHGRERAILQIQALADQHTNRLTLTQSTKKSIEESAPAQDRLRNLHTIVYPPRWAMMKDLADRYANLGIFMSAAELYTQIELWDEVVECYRRSGRESKAEEIVRERLALQETPRMWAALGDLTQDPQCWEKAVELSKGRFSNAFVALGAYNFENGDLVKAAEYYKKALEVRPVAPTLWFRLGTISMQLSRWDDALRAFSRVVQLEPEEHEAWANVAAIHMRNKNPSEAYPALVESLKHFRNNWRVWTSKLYVCLDLKKYDEAVQACNSILDLKSQKQASDGIPPLEERCIRAIVGGILQTFHESRQKHQMQKVDDSHKSESAAALDSSKRSLARVHALLDRLQATNNPEPWLFETIAYFHEKIGGEGSQQVIDNLMKEYRALLQIPGWEKDDAQVKKVCQVVSQITELQRRQGTRETLSKSKFLVRGVIQKVRKSRMDETKVPADIGRLESLLEDLEREIKQQQ